MKRLELGRNFAFLFHLVERQSRTCLEGEAGMLGRHLGFPGNCRQIPGWSCVTGLYVGLGTDLQPGRVGGVGGCWELGGFGWKATGVGTAVMLG